MKFAGAADLVASPEQVWAAVHDPDVLARTLPGCEALTSAGEDRFDLRVTAGVGAVKGSYDGTVTLSDQQPVETLTLRATGAGAPGTVDVTVRVALSPNGSGTHVTYAADAVVGGMVGGVGQRMLTGVTRKMAGAFFHALDEDILGVRVPLAAAAVEPATGGAGSNSPVPRGGRTNTANANASATLRLEGGAGFVLGTAFGAVVALAGVLVGWRVGRR